MQLLVELRKSGLEATAILKEGPFDLDPAVDTVMEQLEQLGVQPLPDAEQIRVALGVLVEPAPPQDGVIIARGVAPQQGVGAQVLPLFPIRNTPLGEDVDPFVAYAKNVVYPGDCILERTPPSPGIPGRSLIGAEVPAALGRDLVVVPGHGVEGDEEGRTFTSITYGVAMFANNRLQIVDGARVSGDFMAAHLTILPDSRVDEAGQLAKLAQTLLKLEIRKGAKRNVLVAAVRKARADGQPIPDVLVAQGRQPRDGREIDYKLLVDADKKIGKEMAGGRIDFREAESVKNVTQGEVLAEVIPAVEPEPGYRVNGEILRPKMIRPEGLKPGQNTAISEDGTHVVADSNGMLVIQGGKFHVADEYLINGDVDYSTGNIHATGAVTVRGQVKPGFEVESGQSVEIHGDVEEARIHSETSVTIRGGVTAGSEVCAEGDVTAKYVQNSKVETNGNLEVKLSVTNSQIYVRGEMTASGSQGAIIGGEVNAALGIEARDIGSPSAKTHVAVGVDLRVVRALEEISRELESDKTTMAHLQANLGKVFLQDPRAALATLPAPLRRPKLDMLQKMQELFKRDKELAARAAELEQINAEMRNAQITVQGEIHAGTVVTISQLRHVLQESLRRVVLYYDADQNQVTWRRL